MIKIKKITKLKVNSVQFKVIWDKSKRGASFDYGKKTIEIGCNKLDDSEIFELICHEIMEVVACELYVRFNRLDVADDYIFVYDHRQHTTIMAMFSGLVSQFIA